MQNRVTTYLCVTLLLMSCLGCQKAVPQAANQSQALLAVSPSATPAPVVTLAPANFDRTLVGTIDGKYAFQMWLKRQDEQLFGNYFYTRPGAIRIISLSGKIDRDGNATLEETSYDTGTQTDAKTGEFRGKLDSVVIDGEQLIRFSGNWTRAKDKQTLPFSAQEASFDLGGGLKLRRQLQKEENKSLSFELESELPQLSGADTARVEKFNQAVKTFTAREVAEFKKTVKEMAADPDLKLPADAPPRALSMSYSVSAANSDFVSGLFSFYSFTGGAHGNTETRAFTYDLKRGQLVRLGELFKPGANYLKVISEFCISEVKKLKVSDDEWIRGGAGAKAENYASWNITPQGLRITFDAYQVAAYAAGPQEVLVPYALLKDLIRPDGLLAAYAK